MSHYCREHHSYRFIRAKPKRIDAFSLFALAQTRTDDHGHVFYIKFPSPEDVARFHGHCWAWWNEYVMFRCIKKLIISKAYSQLLEASRVHMLV